MSTSDHSLRIDRADHLDVEVDVDPPRVRVTLRAGGAAVHLYDADLARLADALEVSAATIRREYGDDH